jgi:hypothetical protein
MKSDHVINLTCCCVSEIPSSITDLHVECNHHYVVDVKSGIIISYCDKCGQIKMQTPVSWGRPSCIEPSTGQDSFERTPTIIAPPQDLSDTITGTNYWYDYLYDW